MIRVTSLIAVLGAVALLPVAATAAPRHHHRQRVVVADTAPPLTVHPRSYLDPGVVAPVGSETQYVWAPMQPNFQLEDRDGIAWQYGVGTLPGPFSGTQQSLVDF